jgi:hypothetical protein
MVRFIRPDAKKMAKKSNGKRAGRDAGGTKILVCGADVFWVI